jgi:hypothetical protein
MVFFVLTDVSGLCRVFCLIGSFHVPYLLCASQRTSDHIYISENSELRHTDDLTNLKTRFLHVLKVFRKPQLATVVCRLSAAVRFI